MVLLCPTVDVPVWVKIWVSIVAQQKILQMNDAQEKIRT